jgi:hypothetical protein
VRRPAQGAASLWLLGLALGLPAAPAAALEPTPGAARVVVFGDDEGTCGRWNERLTPAAPCVPAAYRPGPAACPRGENARHAKLLRHLREGAPAVHAVLHAGDFVRFDRDVDRYAASLGPLAARFFPTTGGDQEFLAGRFRAFVERHAPHIALGDRPNGRRPRCHLCYHAYLKTPAMPLGLHIVALENPDQYGAEKGFYKPHCAPTHDLYRAPRGEAAARQFAWLEETLGAAEGRRAEPAHAADALIVLTHRPVPLQDEGAADLRALFARAHVELVIGGNVHVYARGEAEGIHYFVTGVAGDRLVVGCPEFLSPSYPTCRPATSFRHAAQECGGTECDHFLDIAIAPDRITVRARLIDPLPAEASMDTVTWTRRR